MDQRYFSALSTRARRGLGHEGWGVICETVGRSLAQRGYGTRPIVVAAIALANKIARMAWAMMARDEHYKEPVATAERDNRIARVMMA